MWPCSVLKDSDEANHSNEVSGVLQGSAGNQSGIPGQQRVPYSSLLASLRSWSSGTPSG